jgi:hypothetical protein
MCEKTICDYGRTTSASQPAGLPDSLAVQQALAQQAQLMPPIQQPQVVYVRRNLTVAELLLVLLLSCGIVTGIQWTWNIISNVLPRIEIKAR